jgi:hypothetical protein
VVHEPKADAEHDGQGNCAAYHRRVALLFDVGAARRGLPRIIDRHLLFFLWGDSWQRPKRLNVPQSGRQGLRNVVLDIRRVVDDGAD